jgi:hypothetical protein
MRNKRISISGSSAVVALIAVVVAIVIVLVIIDATKKPPATPQETCTLVHHIVLPDNCVCSVAGKTCTPTATRPYLIFFTQAAACPTLACDIDLRHQ